MSAKLLMVTYNRLELTKQTLDSIFQNTKTPFELIIVDNASSDETVDFLKNLLSSKDKNEYYQGAKLLCNSENYGIAIGRNQTLLLAGNSDWYATLDNDVILPENWLGKCTSIMTENSKYGMIGVNFENVKYPLVDVGQYQVQHKKEGNLGTACMVFSKKVHKMIGFFNDRDYGKYGLEDSDYGFRARVAGFQLGYINDEGVHLGEDGQDKGEYRKFKTEEHNKFLQKFYGNCKLYYNNSKPIYLSVNKEKYNLNNVIEF
jgi:GT2 family glycosyltransferase